MALATGMYISLSLDKAPNICVFNVNLSLYHHICECSKGVAEGELGNPDQHGVTDALCVV